MQNAILNKLEIDILQATELKEAIELAAIHHMPAVVVHPDLVADAVIYRGLRQGKFKIIVPIDCPKGDKYGMAKLQGMNINALSQDGFEILISNKPHQSEIKAELRTITEFIRTHLKEVTEIRFILGTVTRDTETIERICSIFQEVPAPALIRTDYHLKAQQTKTSPQAFAAIITQIQKYSRSPIKISGNINNLKTITTTPAARYAVGLKQIKEIIAEIRNGVPTKITS